MHKVLVAILAVANLGLVAYSGAQWSFDVRPWLAGFPLALPLVLLAVGVLFHRIFISICAIPSILFFSHLLLMGSLPCPLELHDFGLLMAAVDCVYILGAVIRFRYYKDLFFGTLAGILVLLIFHQFALGGLPIRDYAIRQTNKMLDYADSKF
ncbi:MAG TPA: hypothetical protein PK489_14600 [Prolixibacteraceae bacterium]|nr:hypothetical protein [bacterium]HPJ80020.1 hypothetical protein [Prolixibacteraceae bacterium]HPQ66990.1 hypothetical protein [bacterium]